MTCPVHIDGNVTWCASSLRAAQFLAEASMFNGKTVRIVSYAESLIGRIWIYDYRELQWVEQAGGAGYASTRRGQPSGVCRRDNLASAAIPKPSEALTAREIDVLSALSRGYTYAEIADRLGISLNTVTSHIKNGYRKLSVHSGPAAVTRAAALGLFKNGPTRGG